MDYYMPRAGLIPEIRGEEHPTQSKVSPLRVKGAGERIVPKAFGYVALSAAMPVRFRRIIANGATVR